jgi:hypothetical protein
MKCKKCKSEAIAYCMRFFKEQDKYLFHLAQYCSDCGTFNGLATQTKKLIEDLEGRALVDIIPNDRDI